MDHDEARSYVVWVSTLLLEMAEAAAARDVAKALCVT